MARLREVPRGEIKSPRIQAHMTRFFGSETKDPTETPGTLTGTVGNFWTVLANIESLYEIWMDRSEWLSSSDRMIDFQYTELGKTRAGWLRGCQFVVSQHSKVMRGLGLSEEQISRIPEGALADCYDQRQKLVLAYTDDLVQGAGRVPDGRFEQLHKEFTDVEILELTYAILQYEMSSTLVKALRLEYDDRDDPIVEVPAPTEAYNVLRLGHSTGTV